MMDELRGFSEAARAMVSVVRAQKDMVVYCPICHKTLELKAGDVIPRCCGKIMEEL